MNGKIKFSLCRAINNEDGQALIWTAIMVTLLVGVGGLTVDLGRAYVAYRELQASTDAAALAAASQLPITTSNKSSNTVSFDGHKIQFRIWKLQRLREFEYPYRR